MSGKCIKHDREKSGTCSWCSTVICLSCIDDAQGKKYCSQCLTKLPMNSLNNINKHISSRGVKNVDPYLDEDAVIQRRELLQQAKKSEIKKPRITNVFRNLDETKREEIDEWLEKQKELRKKFNF